jgi:serine/threonine-protein kinase
MGSVWAGTHLALETPVAVKFMTWTTAPREDQSATRDAKAREEAAERRARFEREAKAAAQIRSANVVQVFDYGVDRGVPFIVMELLEGEDLLQRLQREGRLSPTATAFLVQAVVRALQRAHDMGLVHRDLKPGNVFLTKEGDREVPKVVDFGVVKQLPGQQKLATEGSENTVEGTLIGTPSYMSPEQAMGRNDVDHRSDLWSLGVILFQTLTGMKPFASGTLFESLVRICSDPIPRPSSIVPDLPAGVDAFFERALERDLGKRFQSAREMERAFYALVARPSNSLPPDAEVLPAPRPREISEPGPVGPVAPVEPVETVNVKPPAKPAQGLRPLLLGAIGAGVVLVAVIGVIALRGNGPAPTPVPPPTPAPPSSSTSPIASAATPENTSAPSVAPSAVASAAPSKGPSPSTPHAGGPAHNAAPAHSSGKPKRDLGY